MPTEKWVVYWKKNRNHRGEEIIFSQKKAMKLAEEKKALGFKVKMKKLPKLPRKTPAQQ